MDSLRTILPRVLRKRGLQGQAGASFVVYTAEQWLRSALPHLISMVHVDRLTHTVLQISCGHSIAAQECLPLLPSLRAFLERECAGEMVSEIRLIRGK